MVHPSSPLIFLHPQFQPQANCVSLSQAPDWCMPSPSQEVPLGHPPLPWRWLRCRCRISTSAQTSSLAVAGNHSAASSSRTSPYKIVKVFLFHTPWFLRILRHWDVQLAVWLSLRPKIWAMYKSTYGFGDCWFFSLEILNSAFFFIALYTQWICMCFMDTISLWCFLRLAFLHWVIRLSRALLSL